MKTRAKRLPLWCTCLALAIILGWSPAWGSAESDIKRIFHGILEAVDRGDADALSRYFHEDVTVIQSGGVHIQGWDAYREKILPAQFETLGGRPGNYTVRNLAIDVDGNNAVATYNFTVDGVTESGPQKIAGQGTAVFRKGKRGWQVVHTQSDGQAYGPADQVREVFDGILQAANHGDVEALGQFYHPDATVAHSGIFIRGWDAYRAKVLPVQLDTLGDRPNYTVGDVAINVNGNSAYATYSFSLDGVNDGTPQKVSGHGTVIFSNGDRGWQVVHAQSEGRPVN